MGLVVNYLKNILLIKNDYEGIFIEKNNCIIIDKNETINLANSNNLFISTFVKN